MDLIQKLDMIESFRVDMNFKSEETFSKFKRWIGNFPESFHHNDMERWNEFVLSVLENGDDVNWGFIKEKKLLPTYHDRYEAKFVAMQDLYAFMIRNGYQRESIVEN